MKSFVSTSVACIIHSDTLRPSWNLVIQVVGIVTGSLGELKTSIFGSRDVYRFEHLVVHLIEAGRSVFMAVQFVEWVCIQMPLVMSDARPEGKLLDFDQVRN